MLMKLKAKGYRAFTNWKVKHPASSALCVHCRTNFHQYSIYLLWPFKRLITTCKYGK